MVMMRQDRDVRESGDNRRACCRNTASSVVQLARVHILVCMQRDLSGAEQERGHGELWSGSVRPTDR